MKRPSDEVEGLRFEVAWEPQKGALGIVVAPEDVKVEDGELDVVSAFLQSFWDHLKGFGSIFPSFVVLLRCCYFIKFHSSYPASFIHVWFWTGSFRIRIISISSHC